MASEAGSDRARGAALAHVLVTTLSDPESPGTTNRQDSIDAPAMVASSISRIKKITFFAPQDVSRRSLWTISEPNDTQTTA